MSKFSSNFTFGSGSKKELESENIVESGQIILVGLRDKFSLLVNLILNLLANKINKPYDNKGVIASKGKLIPELEKKLNNLKFFKLKPPKSLGFEWVKENIFPIFETFQNELDNQIGAWKKFFHS